jgi:hypothetical protein
MLEDGTPPPSPAAIERVCGINRRIEGHADSRGYFSIELGNPVIDSVQDASIGGIGTFGGRWATQWCPCHAAAGSQTSN